MSNEKSGCHKFLSAVWQFPVFSIAFAIIVAVSSVMLHAEGDKLEKAVNETLGEEITHFKDGLLVALIFIFGIDGAITFMSIISSQWVFECCWNKQMQQCPCCTQFVCYTLNWFLFGMAYLLGFLSLVLTGMGSFIIFFGVGARGLCEGEDNDDIMRMANLMIKSIHDWICENAKGTPLNGKCDVFPESIDLKQTADFCSGTKEIYDLGAKFFVLVALVVISQWSFAIIQRANLVEGAVRRDFEKNKNTSESGYKGGPAV